MNNKKWVDSEYLGTIARQVYSSNRKNIYAA
jgi:hypothetical protein